MIKNAKSQNLFKLSNNIVKKMCETETITCRALEKTGYAKKLLDLAKVPKTANIEEIPLCENNQVVILFLIPKDNNYYSLFAGIGNDGRFHFDLTITGILKDNGYFDFYREEKTLNLNYFI